VAGNDVVTGLEEQLGDYLTMRRALGYKLTHQARLLDSFVGYLEDHDASWVSVELAVAWALLPVDADPVWWAQRLGAVRSFAKHLRSLDARNEVPPKDLLAHRARRVTPHIYSHDEIDALMTAARGIHSPFKAATFETLIGLLAATGMRVGEAINLDSADVDLEHAVVIVTNTKFGKSRAVPLHTSTVAALDTYAQQRRVRWPSPHADSFFVSTVGTRLIHTSINAVFRKLIADTGIKRPGERRPRPHDLRHTFAIRVLLGWYRDGEDVQARLPSLSTYLGHTKPTSTYWYLSAVPELMAIAAERLDRTEVWS
jgi:integrase/recombinase XerD